MPIRANGELRTGLDTGCGGVPCRMDLQGALSAFRRTSFRAAAVLVPSLRLSRHVPSVLGVRTSPLTFSLPWQLLRVVGLDVGPRVPTRAKLVGMTGFEPATCGTQNRRATKLRYTPVAAGLSPAFRPTVAEASRPCRARLTPNRSGAAVAAPWLGPPSDLHRAASVGSK